MLDTMMTALMVISIAAGQEAPKAPAARADDVKSIDAIVAAVYDVISGPAGQKRDWDRMRSLFVPGARLIPAVASPNGGATARVLDLDGYIQRSGAVLERDGFFEREIARKMEAFGNIAHVFSTYESKRTPADVRASERTVSDTSTSPGVERPLMREAIFTAPP